MGDGLKRAVKATKMSRQKKPGNIVVGYNFKKAAAKKLVTPPVFPLEWKAGQDEEGKSASFLTDANVVRWGRV